MAIQITEYSYQSANGEFVEFTNTGNSAVDMTGWSFDDNSRIAGSFSLLATVRLLPKTQSTYSIRLN